jgi:hypothetical protein
MAVKKVAKKPVKKSAKAKKKGIVLQLRESAFVYNGRSAWKTSAESKWKEIVELNGKVRVVGIRKIDGANHMVYLVLSGPHTGRFVATMANKYVCICKK